MTNLQPVSAQTCFGVGKGSVCWRNIKVLILTHMQVDKYFSIEFFNPKKQDIFISRDQNPL